MKNIKHLIAPLLFGVTLSSCTQTENSSGATNIGYLKIRERDGVTECSMPTVPGQFLVKNFGCTNDQAYTIRFVNVPSALHITFYDNSVHDRCEADASWQIEVRTLKNPTTTPADDYVGLAAMYGAPDNSIVAPGVLKIRRRDGSPIGGRLTCIDIREGM